jgi:prepilin-type processing-associated H-X9-DG protein
LQASCTSAEQRHQAEDGWQAFVLRWNNAQQQVWPRHGSFANQLWVDGHVSHWMVAQVNGVRKWWDRK